MFCQFIAFLPNKPFHPLPAHSLSAVTLMQVCFHFSTLTDQYHQRLTSLFTTALLLTCIANSHKQRAAFGAVLFLGPLMTWDTLRIGQVSCILIVIAVLGFKNSTAFRVCGNAVFSIKMSICG